MASQPRNAPPPKEPVSEWEDFISSFDPLKSTSASAIGGLSLLLNDANNKPVQNSAINVSPKHVSFINELSPQFPAVGGDVVKLTNVAPEIQSTDDDFGDFSTATFTKHVVTPIASEAKPPSVTPKDSNHSSPTSMTDDAQAIADAPSTSPQRTSARPSRSDIAQMAAELKLSRAPVVQSKVPDKRSGPVDFFSSDLDEVPTSVPNSATETPALVTPTFFQRRSDQNLDMPVNTAWEIDDDHINEQFNHSITLDPKKFSAVAFPSEPVLLADLDDDNNDALSVVEQESVPVILTERKSGPQHEPLRTLFSALINLEMYELAALLHRHMMSETEIYNKSLQLEKLRGHRVHLREIEKLEKKIEELQIWSLPDVVIQHWQSTYHRTDDPDEGNDLQSIYINQKTLSISNMVRYLELHGNKDIADSYKVKYADCHLDLVAKSTINRALEILYEARQVFISHYYSLTFSTQYHVWRLLVSHGISVLQQVFYFILRMKATLAGKWQEQRRVLEQSEIRAYLEASMEIHAVLSKIYTAFMYTKQSDPVEINKKMAWSESLERSLLIQEITLLFEKGKPILKKLSIHLNDLLQMVYPDVFIKYDASYMESEEIEENPEKTRCNLCLLQYSGRISSDTERKDKEMKAKLKIMIVQEAAQSSMSMIDRMKAKEKIEDSNGTNPKIKGDGVHLLNDNIDDWLGVRLDDMAGIVEEQYQENGVYEAIYHRNCLQLWKYKIRVTQMKNYPVIGKVMENHADAWRKRHIKRLNNKGSLVHLSDDEDDDSDDNNKQEKSGDKE